MITIEQMPFFIHHAKGYYHQQQEDSHQKNKQYITLILKLFQEN